MLDALRLIVFFPNRSECFGAAGSELAAPPPTTSKDRSNSSHTSCRGIGIYLLEPFIIGVG